MNNLKKNICIVNNFIKTDSDTTDVEKALEKKYLYNSMYIKFLNNLLEDSIKKHDKIRK